ncbi:MAG: CDP-glucose 4,6-dehydratase, partial [Nitrospinota bacterium]|nr:CDP-glucose 4,6-dehydratase [Nitrospinota bacterium]
SDKCYENTETQKGYTESDPMGGYDPYSNSKGCAELVASAYRNSFFPSTEHDRHGVSVATARAGHVIGGGDWSADRLIPDIMNSVLKNTPVQIRNPQATRPWQFVLNPLSGYLTLAEQQWNKGSNFSEAWNFGPEEEEVKPVSWIVENISSLWGGKIDWNIDTSNHPHEARYLQLDCSKAKAQLGWSSKLPLPSGLEWTVSWYKNYQHNEDMRDLTLEEISRYQKLQS